MQRVRQEDELIYYDGQITISGIYKEYYPDGLLGSQLCFYADDATGDLIPRDPNLFGPDNGDARDPWFCFANQDEAKKMFEIDDDQIFADPSVECVSGQATIEVSDYVVNSLEAGVFDTAKLDRIISKDTYSTNCPSVDH